MDDEKDSLIKYLNTVYDETGFDGVIDEVKSRLVYGSVSIKNDLHCITTGGWSDDEMLLHTLSSPLTKFHKHYVGYVRGGAFYFDKTHYNDWDYTHDIVRVKK